MDYDVVIIGAGPAGYVSAIRSGQLGYNTLVVEKCDIGGMCLNWGCIPSKSLIESAKLFKKAITLESFGIDGIDEKQLKFNWQNAVKKAMQVKSQLAKGVKYLLRRNGVEIMYGSAIISSENSIVVDNKEITASKIIIATGSYPEEGADNEIEIKDFYDLSELPKKIAFCGHGHVAVELAQMAALVGVEVYLVTDKNVLVQGFDKYINDFIIKKLKKDKIKIVKSKDDVPDDVKIVNARMRKAIVPVSEIEIKLDKDGFIDTDFNFKTSAKNIFAIGDVNGKSHYAHAGSAQGLYVINNLDEESAMLDLRKYPLNVYTYPEIAQIGMTEADLKNEGYNYKISSFPLKANGKALINGDIEGEARILYETRFGEVMGVQIIAENASDMIAEASAYIHLGATIYDVASTIHAHPTVSEVFMEAGFGAVDKAIHK